MPNPAPTLLVFGTRGIPAVHGGFETFVERLADHLAARRPRAAIATISYGGDPPPADPGPPPLAPGRYLVSIARIEPDNSILTLVEAFARKPRGVRLVVLGTLKDDEPYHARVRAAGGPEVLFPGAIYEARSLQALRVHALAYLHGHTVGGTTPSLVEALWAGSPVIAHDSPFNRSTAGEGQFYFRDGDGCAAAIERVLSDPSAVAAARSAARARAEQFRWDDVFAAYEDEARSLGGYPPRRPATEAPASVAAMPAARGW